jgi:hypothetical protein
MANVSRKTQSGKDTAIVNALRSGVLGLDQLPLGTKVYTQAEAADLVEGRTKAGAALLLAKAEWEAAILAYAATDKLVDVAVRDLRNIVIARCGETSQAMAAFQFEARKKRVFTQEQQDAIVAKRNATRVLRGTKGRKQKKDIKGVVPAEATVPVQVDGTGARTAAAVAATARATAVLAVAGTAMPAAQPAGSPTSESTQVLTVEGSEAPIGPSATGEPGNKSG